MLACSDYQEDTIRGKEFKDARKFYQNRELLADKLIQSLVQYESSKVAGREYILRAVEYNASELATKKLSEEVKTAFHSADYIQLISFFDLRNNIAEAYSMHLNLPKELPSLGEIRALEQQSAMLAEILDTLREARKYDPIEWIQKSSFIESRLRTLSPTHPRDTYRYHKAKVGLALLREDVEEALRIQTKVVSILEKADFPLSSVILIREISILIRLSIDNGQYDLSMNLLMRLSTVEARSPREDDIHNSIRIKSSVIVAGTVMNLELAKQSYHELVENRERFSDSSYVIHLLGCALVCFAHKDYGKVLEIVEDVRSLSRSIWMELTWVLNALRSIIHYELGNPDVMDSILLASIRKSRKEDLGAYPLFIFKTIQKLAKASPSKSKSVLEEAALQFKELQNRPPIQTLTSLFNFGLWIESKLSGASLADLLLEQRPKGLGSSDKLAL